MHPWPQCRTRAASTHAAGVVVSDVPLVEYVPLHRPTRMSESDEIGAVTQYAMAELEKLGLLKIDFLGLATLTIMRRACEMIRERHRVDLDLDTIPTDDPATYGLLSRGEVMGHMSRGRGEATAGVPGRGIPP